MGDLLVWSGLLFYEDLSVMNFPDNVKRVLDPKTLGHKLPSPPPTYLILDLRRLELEFIRRAPRPVVELVHPKKSKETKHD